MELLGGLSTTSTRPAHRLAELACVAAGRPASPPCSANVTPAPPIGWPTSIRSSPRRLAPTSATSVTAPQATGRSRVDLVGRSADQRERFERALARAEWAYPVREEREFFTMSVPFGLLCYAALEVGRRLTARSQLGRSDGVFLLTRARHGRRCVTARIGRRRPPAGQERYLGRAAPGPASYGSDPGPPPALDALPAEARFVIAAVQWALERILEQAASSRVQHTEASVPQSIAASPAATPGRSAWS